MTDVCIVGARRTPIGRFLGSLSRLSAVDLALHAAQAALTGLPKDRIDQVIVGNVLGAGLGMNIARQIGVRLELPITTPAFTVNMMCGSGLHAVILAAQAIRSGDAEVILCGGTESMSNAPHILPRSRTGTKFGDGAIVDTLLRDGLVDAFSAEHMALTAERLATRYGITRPQQDAFALRSQQRFGAAMTTGKFANELVPLTELDHDEHPRPDTTLDQLAGLQPAFDKSGTITAGNASGINDGAAMLVVASRQAAEANDWPVMAQIAASSIVGCDPQQMGLGPVHALRRLCLDHNVSLSEIDTIEINEAFAAQTLACIAELELNDDQINPHGGAIAMGHPIGTSGARLGVHLAQQIGSGSIRSGAATLCVGGGMGVAMLLHAP